MGIKWINARLTSRDEQSVTVTALGLFSHPTRRFVDYALVVGVGD